MIRCIGIDLDDTLLNSDLEISVENRLAIQTAIQQGVKILLASGRMVQSMRPYALEMGLQLPLIAYNGAIIQESSVGGACLYHQPVPSEKALQVLEIFRSEQIHLNAYLNDELYMDKLTAWGECYANNAGVTPHPIGDLAIYLAKDQPHKLLGVGEVAEIDRVHARLIQVFGTSLQFVKSKPTYLEILAPGVSKGKALQELASNWRIKQSEVMAIGDAPNDLSMVIWAGVGVAIGNASQEVKAKARYQVADHNHNGVAEAIKRFVF